MVYTKAEKEAIEDLGTFNYLLDDVYSTNMLSDEEVNKYEKSIHIVLNLLKKQQKEINELKQENEYLNCICESDASNYINKEAIREKIKELENRIENTQGEELLIYDSKLDILKELLGE